MNRSGRVRVGCTSRVVLMFVFVLVNVEFGELGAKLVGRTPRAIGLRGSGIVGLPSCALSIWWIPRADGLSGFGPRETPRSNRACGTTGLLGGWVACFPGWE